MAENLQADDLALTAADGGASAVQGEAQASPLAHGGGDEEPPFPSDIDDAAIGVWDHAPGSVPVAGGERFDGDPPEHAASDVTEPAPAFGAQASERQASARAEMPVRSRRRRPARLWGAIAIAFVAALAAIFGAASVWGMPEWVPIGRQALASPPDLILRFPADRQDRRTLANGTEFFGASGSITNIGQETRRVPPILIVLRDDSDRIVYRWELAPPKSALAPGESLTINEAVTDVPASARNFEIGWKSG